MNCTECGGELFEGDVFCTQCGTAVVAAIEPPDAGPEEEAPEAGEALVEPSPESAALDDDMTVRRPSRRFSGLTDAAGSAADCPSCGEPMEPGAAFCTECGTAVDAVVEEPIIDSVPAAAPVEAVPEPEPVEAPVPPGIDESAEPRCVSCGEVLEQGAAFCTECGTPRPESEPAPPPVEAVGEPVQEPEPVEAPVPPGIDESAEPRCVSCGEVLEQGAAFCTECGATVVADEEPAMEPVPVTEALPLDEPEPATEAEPETDPDLTGAAACADCGAELASEAAFCTSCGAPVTDEQAGIDSSAPMPVADVDEALAMADSCKKCGSSLAADASFCIACGTPVAGDATIPFSEPSFPVEAKPEPEAEQPTPEPAESSARTCPHCGEAIDEAAAFCIHCGKAVPAVAAASQGIEPGPATPATDEAAAQAAFCIVCGNRLEPNDEFCIKCGLPRDAGADETAAVTQTVATAPQPGPPPIPPPVAEEERTRRSLLPLWITLAVVALGVAGWFVWQALSGGDEEVADSPSDQAQGEQTDEPGSPTTASDGTTATTVDEEACQVAVDNAVVAATNLMGAFAGVSLGDAVSLARVGRQSLPGAGAFDTANASLLGVADVDGCTAADKEALYTSGISEVAAPAGEAARIVHSAAASQYGFSGDDVLTRATAALRMYPIHGAVEVVEVSADGLPKWTVILESLEVDDYTQSDALVNAAAYGDRGIEAEVFLSDDYGSLNSGYWVVYTGIFDTRNEASSLCSSIRSSVDFCYDRYLQQLPTTTGPNGACGPYGRYSVVGVSSGSSLDVRVGPSSGQQVLGTYSRTATGILSAGPGITVGSTAWSPVEINGKIGWAESRFLSPESECAGTTPPTDPAVSCPQVAVNTADLLKAIVAAAAAGDVSGVSAVSSIDMAPFDGTAQDLVEQAGRSGCDVTELNNLVAAQHGAIKADGEFAELVLELLTSQSFFTEG